MLCITKTNWTYFKIIMKYWEVTLMKLHSNEVHYSHEIHEVGRIQNGAQIHVAEHQKLKLMFVRFSKPRHLITDMSSSFPEKHAIYYAIYIIYIYISTPYISNVLRSCRSVRYIMLAKPTIYWDFMNSLFLFWNYELNIESTDESFITSTWKKHPLKNCRMKYLSEIIINK